MTRLDEQIKREVRNVKRLSESADQKQAYNKVSKEFKKVYKKVDDILTDFTYLVQEELEDYLDPDEIDQIANIIKTSLEKLEMMYLKHK